MSELSISLSSSDAVASLPDWQSPSRHPVASTAIVIGQVSAISLHGVEAIVVGQSGFRLAGLTRSFDELIACCRRLGDGIALVDPMLGKHGVRAFMAALKQAAPRLRVVLVTDVALPAVVRAGVESGALGFLCRQDDPGEIRKALEVVAQGRRYLSLTIAEQLSVAMSYEALTQREMDVLRKLSTGCCNKSLARELDVTVGTVKTHLRAIMCKLAANSRVDVLLKASRLGLIHV